MESFDLFCWWLGRIVLGGSAALVALCIFALLVFKVIEKVFGREAMIEKQATMEEVMYLLGWHKEFIKRKEEEEKKEETKKKPKELEPKVIKEGSTGADVAE